MGFDSKVLKQELSVRETLEEDKRLIYQFMERLGIFVIITDQAESRFGKVMDAVNSVGTPSKTWGAKPDSPCAAILIKGEAGKIMGTRWMVSGDLGQVVLSAHRLWGGRQ